MYGIKNAPLKILDIIVAQQARGTDASGVAYIESGKIIVQKKAYPPMKFRIDMTKVLGGVDSDICIGHNRSASTNIVERESDKEAHPFLSENGNFVLVHNGTFTSYKYIGKLLDSLGHNRESGADTEIFVHILEELLKKYPREKAIEKFYPLSDGNMIILFVDGTLYGIPESSFILVKLDNSFIIASEFSGIREFLKSSDYKDSSMTLYVPEESSSLVKIWREKGEPGAELYGEWNEAKVKEGSWLFNKITSCDFCGNLHVPCEEIKIGNLEKDRCIECYRKNKTKLRSEDFYTRKREDIVTKDENKEKIEKDEKCICRECKVLVEMNTSIFCSRCKKFYCEKCINTHACRENNRDPDFDLVYFLGHEAEEKTGYRN
uniref:glutamine--fructose-6-phosphate transaminase (isomerizing) n=1 Tax=viral metagenome TaxID=1070528 RepID=A0A6H1ZKD0_9ZZZZ